ncbi:MAG: DHHA1 domain-containing protein [Acidobacteria bacterium]|nr:DHHA1 domain-containing protein [Acidobacteriota bacterium]
MAAPLIWSNHPCDDDCARTLARELGLSPVVARLLAIRGLGDVAAASRFLYPSLEHLFDPLRLADMDRAVDRLLRAIDQQEIIAVHGDYDVDGITSTVILRRALELFGARVVHFIPERLRDGYGLQPAALERLHAEGVQIIVSVDCGIRGAEAARRARELGLDLIVTDHHEPDTELPDAYAVVAGRMSTPDIATRLLLASDERLFAEAQALAVQLDVENTRRRQEEQDILAQAKKIIETDPEVGAHSVLVVAGDQWHRGVIGIVASKIVDAFYRPAIVLSIEDGVAHGSCRSIPGFDMLAALESCAPLLARFGGHKQAAGLQLDAARVRELRHAINAYAIERLGPEDLRPRLWLDGPLTFGHISSQVASELNALAPFGAGNPRPVFHTTPVEVVDGPRKLKERHLKMSFRQDGRTFRAIAWNGAEREAALTALRARVELAYTLEENEFQGNRYLELRVEDFRTPG